MPKKSTRKKRIKVTVLPVESLIQRDTAMFKDWIAGVTHKALAEKYGMTDDNVQAISKKYNWKQLRKDLATRAYSKAIDRIRDMTVKMAGLLDDDIDKIAAEVAKKKRMLTPEERAHFRSLQDRLLKENRLEDGKPTDTIGGTVKTELVLPPGVKAFGIIPPAAGVTMTEATPEEVKEVIDLDKIDED